MTATTLPRNHTPVRASRDLPRPSRRVLPSHGPVRLTRRGRVVVVLLMLALLLGIGFTLGRVSQSHAAAPLTSTVVRPGDTLWSIAARVAPHRDTRQVVSQIITANHLPGASVQVGQRLMVPAS